MTLRSKNSAGPVGQPDQQTEISKGAVSAGTGAFDVQLPNGQLFKFTLTIVKGGLQGEMVGERDGVVSGKAKVDAGKAAPEKAQ